MGEEVSEEERVSKLLAEASPSDISALALVLAKRLDVRKRMMGEMHKMGKEALDRAHSYAAELKAARKTISELQSAISELQDGMNYKTELEDARELIAALREDHREQLAAAEQDSRLQLRLSEQARDSMRSILRDMAWTGLSCPYG